MKKKMLALVMAAMMTSLIACGAGEADDGKYDIGVVQLVQHVALDAATQGFVDTVNAALGEENINWDIQNAAGDSNTCNTIANSFVSAGVDLIMANATPAVQAVVTLLKLDTNYLKLITALIVALFLTVPYLKSKYTHPKLTPEMLEEEVCEHA